MNWSLWEIIFKGGILMVPLMIESMLALAIFFDRWLAFRANARLDTRALRARVLDLLAEDKVEEAAALCANTPSPVSAVLLTGLQAYDKHRRVSSNPELLRRMIEDAISSFAPVAISAVEKRLNVLAFIGNSAPLFGMTGTVTGMITSFGAIGATGSLEGPQVAGGISEALITTAAGLIIAMSAVIPYHYYTARANRLSSEMEEAAGELLDFIYMRHAQSALAAPPPPPSPSQSPAPSSPPPRA